LEENTKEDTTENIQEANQSNKMNPMLLVGIIVAVLIIGAVVVLGMGASNTADSVAEKTENTVAPIATTQSETMDEAAPENVIEVEGGSFYFKPNEIRVKAGETVTIKLNSADMMHDFVIDELDVRTEIVQGGSSGSVTFTPTEPGEYEFYCSVSNHRAQGMVGTLIVEEYTLVE